MECYTQTDRQTDGTDFIPSTADAGGNYGERQWVIGYSGIQDRYVASIGKVTVLHDCE